ncbi:hypothetical protein B0H21DRAFT_757325 [Amylocystis lapponica]|nr:hypothetical protein B0H21DRAFT_757325 [Amylocystis lapponica]
MINHSAHPLDFPPQSCMDKGAPHSPLFLQERTLEIIQLIEVPAPPRAQRSSTKFSSSVASSSYTSSSSSSTNPDSVEESAISSYCSSDAEDCCVSVPDDTYTTRLKRVLAWRENHAKATGLPLDSSSSLPHAPKRKSDSDDLHLGDDTDAASHTSKRSRRSEPARTRTAWPQRRLSAHSCPACDAPFATPQSLQAHGQESPFSDACREAVEYGFEP